MLNSFFDFFLITKILDHFFRLFSTFFQISSRTWGINFDTIACLFELVYGQKNSFSSNFRLFEKVQNDLGIKNS